MYKRLFMEQHTHNTHIMDRLVIFIHATKKSLFLLMIFILIVTSGCKSQELRHKEQDLVQ